MANLNPKQFIEAVFINDLSGIMAIDKPYISFVVMAIGIEYLGKCIAGSNDWDEKYTSRQRFEGAINDLSSLNKYKFLLPENGLHDLYSSLRCGLAHSARPKKGITLSSKGEASHLSINARGSINLKCEEFFNDFISACGEVRAMNFSDPKDKMNQPFLGVPEYPSKTLTATNVMAGSVLGGPITLNDSSSIQ